jgi:hypothetical protein
MKSNSEAQLKIFYLFFGLLLLNSFSYADSSCWPEEHLIGNTAIGFIEGANYVVFKNSELKPDGLTWITKKCEVRIYATPAEKDAQLVACDKLECIKGACGDGGEYTSLPITESKNLFVQINLKDKKKAWLKLNNLPEVKLVLPINKVGNLFPGTTQVFDSPNGKLLKVKSSKKLAYTFKKVIRIKDEDWAEVEINPILSDEPPVEVGKSVARGYFLFRTKENKIAAVLSDIWCD